MLSSIRAIALGVSVLGVSFFFGALVWEHVGHATPCIMCYIERWCFLFAGILGLLAAYARRPLSVQRLLGAVGFVFLTVSVVLFRHMGTQYKWFRVPGICRSSRPLSEFDLSEQLLSPLPQATCDQIEFTLMGQPPTFYLFGLSLGLVCICFWAFFKTAAPNHRFYRRR